MWLVWIATLVGYGFASWYSLVSSAAPSASCRRDGAGPCYHPLMKTGQEITMELWLFQELADNGDHRDAGGSGNGSSDTRTRRMDWVAVPTCRFDVTLPETGKLPTLVTSNDDNQNGTKCLVPIPNSARIRSTVRDEVHALRARFAIYMAGVPTATTSTAVGVVPFEISRVIERRPRRGPWAGGSQIATEDSSSGRGQARNLLEQPSLPKEQQKENQTTKINEGPMWIPYLKYGCAPVRIRFVAEDREYGRLERADGLRLQKWNRTTYAPIMYVDDLSLQKSAQRELAPPEDGKPPIQLRIKLGSLSPIFDSLNRQTQTAFQTIEQLMPGEELDEIRYFLQDERLYRFILTQIISYLHLMFDYLAFRDEIRFYKGRKNLSGVSTSTAITRFVCSLIILLYLMDSGGTSWVVLFSMCSSVGVDGWKVWKLLRPEWSTSFPFVKIGHIQTAREQETAEYDRIALKNLAMILYPLVIGWSLFALRHYEYKSWYSWLISNLANAVYTFGFISLCPQLYINYRLKSVAHLPWKVFMYKIFNTFVDDAFAWIIEMPWKHRIMTLSDDVIFLMFLIQVYLYRVDKSRTNEFGYAYDDSAENQIGPGNISEPNTEDTSEKPSPSRVEVMTEKEKQQ